MYARNVCVLCACAVTVAFFPLAKMILLCPSPFALHFRSTASPGAVTYVFDHGDSFYAGE